MDTKLRFGIFAALIGAMLTSGWLSKTGSAQGGIFIDMQPASPITMASSSLRSIEFIADGEGLDGMTSMSVVSSEEACSAVACPVILERGTTIESGLILRVPVTFSMPALPNDYEITRSFYFTVTARGFINPPETPIGTGPIPLEAPYSPDQTRPLIRTATRNFTMTVSGAGIKSPTITPVPAPPTATSTPSNTPPTATSPPQPTLSPQARRYYLPISIRLEGPEVEPNNDQSGAQPITSGTIIRGRLNDSYDVFKFTLPTTMTVNAELSGIPDAINQRVQLRLDPITSLSTSSADFERSRSTDVTLTLQQTLGPGSYILYVFTDPAFLSPNTIYQLRFVAR
jgi:hypothetical protein